MGIFLKNMWRSWVKMKNTVVSLIINNIWWKYFPVFLSCVCNTRPLLPYFPRKPKSSSVLKTSKVSYFLILYCIKITTTKMHEKNKWNSSVITPAYFFANVFHIPHFLHIINRVPVPLFFQQFKWKSVSILFETIHMFLFHFDYFPMNQQQ